MNQAVIEKDSKALLSSALLFLGAVPSDAPQAVFFSSSYTSRSDLAMGGGACCLPCRRSAVDCVLFAALSLWEGDTSRGVGDADAGLSEEMMETRSRLSASMEAARLRRTRSRLRMAAIVCGASVGSRSSLRRMCTYRRNSGEGAKRWRSSARSFSTT